MIRNKAFTLAEVLITLAIIGVIAAISVPSLIQKTNKAELITAWKKNYAVLNQAFDKLLFDSGTLTNTSSGTVNKTLNTWLPYLKTVKVCYSGTVQSNCWADGVVTKTGTTVTKPANSAAMILNSGAFVVFHENSGTNIHTYVHVDVNGFKKPNIIGSDIFGINFNTDGTTWVYQGSEGSGVYGCEGSGDQGWGCSAKYLYSN